VTVAKPIPGTKGVRLRDPLPKTKRKPKPGDGKGNAKLTDTLCACGCGRYLSVMCITNRERYATRDCAGLPAPIHPSLRDDEEVSDADLQEIAS
jgi:hypothetical protein